MRRSVLLVVFGLSAQLLVARGVNAAPVALFTVTFDPGPPSRIAFDGSASLATLGGGETLTSTVWDFGDGNTDSTSGLMVNHAYSVGNWTASLTLHTSLGATPSVSHLVTMVNQAPVADAGGPYSLFIGNGLSLDGSASFDPNVGDSIVSYAWDLNNDGHADATGVSPAISAATLSALGLGPGTHSIRLNVTDTFGGFDDDVAAVTVLAATAVPEPGTIALLASGLVGLAFRRSRRRQ